MPVAPNDPTLCTNGSIEIMKRILIATDGAAGGREAVEQGIELASATGAEATIVCVRRSPHPILGDPYYQRALNAEFAHAREVVDEAAKRAAEVGVEAEPEILEGDPADEIVQLGRLRNADLIVVGSRALGPLTGTLLGSVSRGVVHHADRPVLVVPQRAKDRRAAA
jgi:nucleotide-binding universal stress UspA family protein